MRDLKEKYIERVHELIRMGEDITSGCDNTINKHTHAAYYEWATGCKIVFKNITGSSSEFYQDFVNISQNKSLLFSLAAGIGMLNALKTEIELGFLANVQTLALAEVFSDSLEMAAYLLERKYKDPATFLIGVVLENELRKLAEKNNISIKKRDDISSVNNKLAHKGIYDIYTQRQIHAWKKLRDNAAHGKFDEYDEKQVKAFLDGTRDFLVKHLS